MRESVPVQLTRGLWGTRSMSHCRTWTFSPLVLVDKVQTFKPDQAVCLLSLHESNSAVGLGAQESSLRLCIVSVLGYALLFLCLILAQWELVLLVGAGTVTPHLTPDWSLWWSVFICLLPAITMWPRPGELLVVVQHPQYLWEGQISFTDIIVLSQWPMMRQVLLAGS